MVGFAWALLPAIWAGATVLLQPRFSASRYWEAALAHRATIGAQVLYTTRVLAQMPVPENHCFRQWTDAQCRHDIESRFRVRVVGGWGMTEIAGEGIVGDAWAPQPDRSIGRPAMGYTVRIRDDAGRPVQPGETGHLTIRGERGVSVFAEYFGQAAVTAASFDDEGFFITGDRVILREDGFIQFADRAKDVIKVGGEGVSPAEIESVIATIAGVKEVAVVGRDDERYSEVPVAFVVAAEGAGGDLPARIQAHCADALARFKQPREIVLLDELPRIGFGKISKAKLRDMAAARKS